MLNRRIVIVAVLGVFSSAQAGTLLYVDDDAPLGGDGLSWNTAYKFLQDALFEAAGNATINEIRVAQGAHEPDHDENGNVTPGDRAATFQLISGVSLIAGYAGLGAPDPDARDIDLYETILSGDLLGDDGPDFVNNDENSFHVVTGSGTDGTAVLDGLTIFGGNANGEFQNVSEDQCGGGLFNAGGSPTLIGCTIEACWASLRAGAVYNTARRKICTGAAAGTAAV